ncbi:hypothetical protein C8R46DRAFT_877092, partial [Mycena filopes]
KFDIQFVPGNSQICCLAHVINLVVQKILAVLNEADDPAVIDYYLPNKDLPFHYVPEDDPNLRDLENEEFTPAPNADDEEDAEVEVMTDLAAELASLSPLQKLRLTATKICASPQRRLRFKRVAASIYKDEINKSSGRKLSTLMIVRDVKHRWNYTKAMISRALLLRKYVFNTGTTLSNVGQIFTQVTLQMSKSSTPTLPWVLPMYEHMLKHLQATRDDGKILQPLRVAAAAGLDKLNVYYEKARGCQFNVIATILHPSLGLAWFGRLNDEKERQNKAVILFEHAFESYKKTYDDERAAQRTAAANSHPHARPALSFLNDVCMLGPEDDDDEGLPTDAIGELTLFWAAYRTHGRGDRDRPLSWWKVCVFPLPSSTLDPHSAVGIRAPLPDYFADGAGLFGDSRYQRLRRAALLTLASFVP